MTDLRITKLMEIAAKPLKKPLKKKIEYSSNVYDFIGELGIKSSQKDLVAFSIIYLRYHKWCKNTNRTAKGFNSFSSDFKKKFTKSPVKRIAAFFVNPTGFDLTAKNEQEAREFLQDVLSGKKTKKKTDRQSKTDETTES